MVRRSFSVALWLFVAASSAVGQGAERRAPIHFEHDVVPILSRYSCNFSGCHGKAEGQNGFKLSVFGFDAQADYDALTKEGRGRRVSPASPDASLLLQKAAGLVPHGGGPRIDADSREFAVLRDWIAEGARFGDPDAPHVVAIRMTPHEELLQPGATQQLRVTARYSDDREVDVTGLARFQSNNDAIATVDEDGRVQIGDLPGQAAVMASFAGAVDVFSVLVPQATKVVDDAAKAPEANFIDRLVNTKLRRLNIAPSSRCDDAEFLRRVTLDVIGTLPTAAEARSFLADTSLDKRARWVDGLLDRPEFADYWALKWADLLRVERQVLGHKGARDFYEWIRTSFATNKPLDVFTRELLTADGPLAERPEGAFYRVVTKGEAASTVAQIFLGVRIACAECHHHPYDRWSQTDYHGLAAYFTQVSRKSTSVGDAIMVSGDPISKHPRTGEPIMAYPLGESMPAESVAGDRRIELAAWMTSPENPWFARNLANRSWAHFLGRGLVEPIDDVRATNPPSNPELLDALAASLVDSGFDYRQLIRTITASETYQRTTTPNVSNLADEQNYSRALLRRMDAEVLLDAVCQTTGVAEKFAGVPAGTRAVQLWDSRVSHYFLKLFGRPIRSTACSCERNAEPNVGQVLHLLNSPELQAKLEHRGGRLVQLADTIRDPNALADELYLTFLARRPTDEERSTAATYLQKPGTGRHQAAQDLAWSLMNTLEFTFNH